MIEYGYSNKSREIHRQKIALYTWCIRLCNLLTLADLDGVNFDVITRRIVITQHQVMKDFTKFCWNFAMVNFSRNSSLKLTLKISSIISDSSLVDTFGYILPLFSARPAVTSVAFTRWRQPYTIAHIRFQNSGGGLWCPITSHFCWKSYG